MKGKSWKILAALLALLLAVLIYFAATAYQTIRSTQTTPIDESGQQRQAAPSQPDTSQPSPGLSAFVGGRGEGAGFSEGVRASVPQISRLGLNAADDYRRRARFPKSTVPIEDNSDPIQRERTVSPARQGGPGGAEPTLTAFPSQVTYEAPERVVVYAYFSEGDARVPADILTAAFVSERHGEVASVALNDSGAEDDEAAGDFIYTGTFAPAPDRATDLAGTFLVSVRGLSRSGDERAVSSGFLYNAPDARPTGRFRDRLADGSLVVDVEIEVFRPGRFHVEGSLFTLAGEGVAWAQNAARFQPGRHWFPLTFYGLAIREQGFGGPFLLRSLALSTVTNMPNQKNRVLEDAYQTKAYRASDFTDQPYNDPDLLEAAERLESSASH